MGNGCNWRHSGFIFWFSLTKDSKFPLNLRIRNTNSKMSLQKYDSISLSILWSRLLAIVDEAGTTLQRTSFSTVTRESNEFAVVLMDEQGRSIA